VPISDSYILQYLVDGTREVPEAISWRENPDQLGYQARVEGVDAILEPEYSRAGSHLILRFRYNDDEFRICEPAVGGWLGRRFSTEDELHMVRLFRELITAVAAQCATRVLRAERNREQIREQISRRLLFGQSEARQELADAHRDRVRIG
jgi:hypothetical protein